MIGMDVKLELIVLLVIQLIGGSAFSRSSNVLIKLTFPFGSKQLLQISGIHGFNRAK